MKEVLYISVSPKLKGGVSSVTRQYLSYFKGSKIIPLKIANSHLDLILYPLLYLNLIFKLLINRISVVHIHGASKGSFYRKYFAFLIVKFLFRKKVIYHIHGGGFHEFYDKSNSIIRKLIKQFINRSDILICLSDSWKDFFESNFTPKKILVLPNAVSIVRPLPKRNSTDKSLKFLFLGKVGIKKGVYDLIDVCQQLKKSYNGKFEVWIGGDGEVYEFKNKIKELQLEDTIKYLGWVAGVKKEDILMQADVFVLPSYNEGLPISMLEAMAYGMPVICTKVGGIPDVVRNDKSGFLIEPRDQEKLKASMEKFINSPGLTVQMGNCSYNIIKEKYTTEIVFQSLESIYSMLNNSCK